MSKDTYFFSHDYNARTDKKIKPLLAKYGMLGYGIFWSIVEDLYNNANALPTDYNTIAYDLRVDENVVSSVINDFGLFIIDGDIFSSNSVKTRLEKRNEKSENARKSAFKRWNDANALQPNSKGIALKERKEKEIKGKENKDIICDANASDNYKKFFDWAYTQGNAIRVMTMSKPLKPEQYDNLLNEFTKDEIFRVVQAMENNALLHKKYLSTYLTIRNWANNKQQ